MFFFIVASVVIVFNVFLLFCYYFYFIFCTLFVVAFCLLIFVCFYYVLDSFKNIDFGVDFN